jgi:hypothetical protein
MSGVLVGLAMIVAFVRGGADRFTILFSAFHPINDLGWESRSHSGMAAGARVRLAG